LPKRGEEQLNFVVQEEQMAIPSRIRDFLDSENIPYEELRHEPAYTGQEVAHTLHLSGKRCAKTVVLDGDGRLAMAVLPAANRLNLQDLRAAMEVTRLEMLAENTLSKLFPDCERGAIPPLGRLYGMEVWVDRTISDSEKIVFCAGTHEDCIRMKYSDFAKLARPRIGRFSEVWATTAA
jgi:Ala-tRNA(Pro) deacylase